MLMQEEGPEIKVNEINKVNERTEEEGGKY